MNEPLHARTTLTSCTPLRRTTLQCRADLYTHKPAHARMLYGTYRRRTALYTSPSPARSRNSALSTIMVFSAAAAVVGTVFLVGGVDSIFRLTLRGFSPVPCAIAVAQLAVATGLYAKGFTVMTSASFAVVAATIIQGLDKGRGGGCPSRGGGCRTSWDAATAATRRRRRACPHWRHPA